MPPGLKAKWLEPVSWDDVTKLNARLCEAKDALHKATSDGHDATRELWDHSRKTELTLEEAIVICRRCHHLAPFCFFNGNTFVAIARGIIQPVLVKLVAEDPIRAASFRSIVGHFVAGTVELEDLKRALSDALE